MPVRCSCRGLLALVLHHDERRGLQIERQRAGDGCKAVERRADGIGDARGDLGAHRHAGGVGHRLDLFGSVWSCVCSPLAARGCGPSPESPYGTRPDGDFRTAALFRQQRESAVPVFRRRVFLILWIRASYRLYSSSSAWALVGGAAAFDRRQRALPVAAAITGQHLDGQVAQPLKAAGLRGVFAAGDGIDDLGLLLALDHDEIELEDRELVLDRERGLGADDDRKSIFLGLALQPRGQVDAVAEHRIVELAGRSPYCRPRRRRCSGRRRH